MKRIHLGVLLMCANLCSSALGAETGSKSEVEHTVHADIPYYSESELANLGIRDAQRVTLDVYEPKSGQQLPVVVFAHGGAWQRGDKTNVGYKPDFFLRHGFVFVSINYRFRPHVEIETLPEDVTQAIAWVHANVNQFRGNGEQIFLMGHSAGAHLMSLVALRADLLKSVGLDPTAIKGVAELDTRALDVPKTVAEVPRLFLQVFGNDPQTLVEMSPYHQIKADRYVPPFLFVVANNNEPRLDVSRRMQQKLKNIGIASEMIEAPDRTHGTLNQLLGSDEDSYGELVVNFFRQQP